MAFSASLSARRAWIEIAGYQRARSGACVALRKESVDRNIRCSFRFCRTSVALRKESVDRNSKTGVALSWIVSSLSARRAWIEISRPSCFLGRLCVALRKESVDRNIFHIVVDRVVPLVALRKESVDRNLVCRMIGLYATVALRKESVDRNKLAQAHHA